MRTYPFIRDRSCGASTVGGLLALLPGPVRRLYPVRDWQVAFASALSLLRVVESYCRVLHRIEQVKGLAEA